ncbi:MAG: hypothetical protein Q9160_005151 [Pyrenula sp. 1 TL-2023]
METRWLFHPIILNPLRRWFEPIPSISSADNDMEMLYCAGISQNSSSHASWMPDWTQNKAAIEDLGFKLEIDMYKTFHATKDSKRTMRLSSDDPNTLIVRGGIIDEIVKISEDLFISDEATSHHRLFRWLDDLEDYSAQIKSYPVDCYNLEDVQARILLSNMDLGRNELPADDLAEAYIAFRTNSRTRGLASEERKRLDEAARPVADNASEMINGRRPCLTRKGYQGYAPDATRHGDLVALFLGAIVPFVIRPKDRSQDQSYFSLVGECYIHGVMKGEAFDAPDFSPCDVHLQ